MKIGFLVSRANEQRNELLSNNRFSSIYVQQNDMQFHESFLRLDARLLQDTVDSDTEIQGFSARTEIQLRSSFLTLPSSLT